MPFFSYFQNYGNGNFEAFYDSVIWEDHTNAYVALVALPDAC
jgi:hypothetical protein